MEIHLRMGIHIQASIPESYELVNAWAGILTYSPLPGLPTRWLTRSGHIDRALVIELTAAGQLRIYTVFPFNPGLQPGTLGGANVGEDYGIAN